MKPRALVGGIENQKTLSADQVLLLIIVVLF